METWSKLIYVIGLPATILWVFVRKLDLTIDKEFEDAVDGFGGAVGVFAVLK